MTVLLFLAGAGLLIVGAEFLVRGASRLAVAAGITPLVVGLTVVAFGTSAPELAVTVGSAWSSQADLALGNALGSNIFNVLFILGLSALITPLLVADRLVRLDVPLLIAVSILALLLALDGNLGRADGALLFTAVVVYTVFLVWQSRREQRLAAKAYLDPPFGGKEGTSSGWLRNLGLVGLGLGLLVVGAQWLVSAAVHTAEVLGVSELVIGLTIVAAGTSLPEVATSVLASVRGQRDIAVGNVVGSCIFNLLVVLGLGSLVSPQGIPVPQGALSFDFPVMIGVAVATLPVFFTGHRIARWEGAVFFGYYVAYTIYLILDATDHGSFPEFRVAMVWFVLPLTVLTLLVLVIRAIREGPSPETPGSDFSGQ